MKPAVKLVKGLHITASDKRAILDVIDYLRQHPEADPNGMYSRKGSRKSYGIIPDPNNIGRYGVSIRENYRTDYGELRQHTRTVFVEVSGIEHLAPRDGDAETADLFEEA